MRSKNAVIVALAISAALLILPHAARATTVWIEGENPASADFNGAESFPGIVSGGRILALYTTRPAPPAGYHAAYTLAIPAPGVYHIWVAATVPDGSTSPFRWTLDGKPGGLVSADSGPDPTGLYGVSGAMSWMKLTTARLSMGRHTVTFRVNKRRADGNYLMYIDALFATTENRYPVGLVTEAGVEKLGPEPSSAPEPRPGHHGPPMQLGSSVGDPRQNHVLHSLGFTLLQTDSNHLVVNQTAPGVWDWDAADAGLKSAHAAGCDWMYFPHYHWAPAWLQKTREFIPSVCLTNGSKITAMSVWSPYLVPWFEQCYAALRKHYGGKTQPVNAIYLGVHGDFGECIFPMGWHPDEKKLPVGPVHPCWWCADPAAKESYRRMVLQKYGGLQAVNRAYGTRFASPQAISFPPIDRDQTASAPIRRRFLDFEEWYSGGMTYFAGQVMRIAGSNFPHSRLMVPIGGGDENLMYGQDLSGIVKQCARYGVIARSTHGGFQPVPRNLSTMLKRIATAAKFYHVPFWSEPPGNITGPGEVGRFFESLSCGAKGFWDWGSNPVANRVEFRRWRNYLTVEQPVVDVALFFPSTDHHLHPGQGLPQRETAAGEALRDVMDFDIVDERLVNDGALSHYRVLIVPEGNFISEQTLRKMLDWERQGGLVVTYNFGPVTNVDGDSSTAQKLFGVRVWSGAAPHAGNPASAAPPADPLPHLRAYLANNHPAPAGGSPPPGARVIASIGGAPLAWWRRNGRGYSLFVNAGWKDNGLFFAAARDAVYDASRMDRRLKNAIPVDDQPDQVYAVLLKGGEVVYYNNAGAPVTRLTGGGRVTIPPHGMASVHLKSSARPFRRVVRRLARAPR
ncbi:MAG TPA: family 14 glycosylhydrolase [Armatimonadota bacterium]|nr:family 14 glycosylhydrolase [Armatimonadota bacterium]